MRKPIRGRQKSRQRWEKDSTQQGGKREGRPRESGVISGRGKSSRESWARKRRRGGSAQKKGGGKGGKRRRFAEKKREYE